MTERICTLPECGERHKAHGYCSTHYRRWKATGDPHRPPLPPICSVETCDEPRYCKGVCRSHYGYLCRHGDPELDYNSPSVMMARFRAQVGEPTDRGCTEWQGSRDPDGYGVFFVGARGRRAHRWIYQELRGAIAPELVVRHHCDNPPCVNIEHLADGTIYDNRADAVARGRQARGATHGAYTKPHRRRRGVENGKTFLTDEQIVEIRQRCAEGQKQKDIARHFGTTQGTVSKIKRGATWAHVS